MVRKTRTGQRVVSHDPITGAELPMFVYFVPPFKGKRKTHRYRLKVPEAHCKEQGIVSKSAVFETLAELLDSKLYKKVLADDERHYRDGTACIRRSDAVKQASIQEHRRMLDENVPIHPDIHFRHQGAVWAVTRTFGTGWTFRATAHTYADAEHLHRACANVRSVQEVVGDETTEADKHRKLPFSRKMLARVRTEAPREGGEEEQEGEEVQVEAVEVVDEDEDDEDDGDEEDDEEEEEDVVVEGVTFRSSRSGRPCKRPNLYAKEAARPQQGKRKVAAVVGRPVLAVAVDKAGPSASGASSDAPIPVYDDEDAMQSLKAIRERIAHLL
jgi:hypothetical protein